MDIAKVTLLSCALSSLAGCCARDQIRLSVLSLEGMRAHFQARGFDQSIAFLDEIYIRQTESWGSYQKSTVCWVRVAQFSPDSAGYDRRSWVAILHYESVIDYLKDWYHYMSPVVVDERQKPFVPGLDSVTVYTSEDYSKNRAWLTLERHFQTFDIPIERRAVTSRMSGLCDVAEGNLAR